MKPSLTTVKFNSKALVMKRIEEDMKQPKTLIDQLKVWLNDDVYIPIPNAITIACIFIFILAITRLAPPSASYYAYTITVYDALGNRKIY